MHACSVRSRLLHTHSQPKVAALLAPHSPAGWMSNRGRQNVASYLALDLGVDWRRGADLFEHLLLDYDVASNWGNWVAAAGLTGGRINHFNITKQSKDYDPDGDYIRHWLPELQRVPTARIHEPWWVAGLAGMLACQQHAAPFVHAQHLLPVAHCLLRSRPLRRLMSRDEQAQYGVQIGADYPAPIPASRFGRPHGGGRVGGDPAGPAAANAKGKKQQQHSSKQQAAA